MSEQPKNPAAVQPTFDSEVAVTLAGNVATLWLNRPAKRNAVTDAMWRGIGEAVATLPGEAHVLVIRGVGDHFCAGADISELGEIPMSDYHAINKIADDAISSFPGPTIAFITGSCVGGGAQIALACDLRIAESSAIFGITPAKLGILYPSFAVERAVRILGPSATKHLLYSGEIVDANRALQIGLINELLPVGAGEARLSELTTTMSERSLLTQHGSKAMVDACVASESIPSELVKMWLTELDAGPDFAEGKAAFAERRSPKFTWRPAK